MSTKVLEAHVRSRAGLAFIELSGEISAPAEDALNHAYEQALRGDPDTILLDFDKVDYINSTGIALILNLLVKAGRAHKRLFAYGLNNHYREIFRITRLSDFMSIYENESAALAAL